MPLIALGLNHSTAPVGLRELVAFDAEGGSAATRALAAQPGVREAAVLSTCNRTELYCNVEAGHEAGIAAWLAAHHGLGEQALQAYLYRHQDEAAVRHLFRVATGLDSLVLGEPQILGQVKQAWQAARGSGSLDSGLDRLFQHAFAVAKRVRTDTRIGAHPVSVAFAAVRLTQQVFAELDTATVLLVGAGDTIELAARHLAEHDTQRLLFANRTLAHAQALASRFGGFALPLAELTRHLPEADIVFSATASREPVIGIQAVRDALRERRHRPMLFMDLAVPRDVEPEVGRLDDVYLYTVDDLDHVVEEGRRSRREAAEEAEAIIELQVEHFMAWWRASDQHEVLKTLRQQAEAQRDTLLERAMAALAAGRPAQQVVEQLANALTNKLLHAPSSALRHAALRGDLDLVRSAQRLFDLESPLGRDADDTGHSP
ncbi:glutamyl-tRNA reductase [Pseudomarimonas salicorniae]|uniref:Glutamyl-tRNA reductase n=1 Tax=Pseudomarimonas salicorniae TaxID=2933270 RepID=A0ABT0GIB8_9GAMM|nr:glutamyl-tRNA reductase [Lysobacter sp. CAU 1642]MCK7594292.1 glutamyl-tRNA reductase [Lysobacter sp. CAU 1642]